MMRQPRFLMPYPKWITSVLTQTRFFVITEPGSGRVGDSNTVWREDRGLALSFLNSNSPRNTQWLPLSLSDDHLVLPLDNFVIRAFTWPESDSSRKMELCLHASRQSWGLLWQAEQGKAGKKIRAVNHLEARTQDYRYSIHFRRDFC